MMSLTVGSDANDDEEADVAVGSMVVSMDGSRLRAPSKDVDPDVEESFDAESFALESTIVASEITPAKSLRDP